MTPDQHFACHVMTLVSFPLPSGSRLVLAGFRGGAMPMHPIKGLRGHGSTEAAIVLGGGHDPMPPRRPKGSAEAFLWVFRHGLAPTPSPDS